MVDQSRYRSYEPDIDSLEQDIANLTNDGVSPRPYTFGRTARNHNDYQSGDSVPLFLSDPDGEPDPAEFDYEGALHGPRRLSVSTKILMATIAASTVAVAFAWFSSDATRDMLVSARASIATVLPVPSAAAQPDILRATTQLTQGDIQLKEPTKGSRAAPRSGEPDGLAQRAPRSSRSRCCRRVRISRRPISRRCRPCAGCAAAAAPSSGRAACRRGTRRRRAAGQCRRSPGTAGPANGSRGTHDPDAARQGLPRHRRSSFRPAAARTRGQWTGRNAALMLAQTYDPDGARRTGHPQRQCRARHGARLVPEGRALGSAEAEQRLALLSN